MLIDTSTRLYAEIVVLETVLPACPHLRQFDLTYGAYYRNISHSECVPFQILATAVDSLSRLVHRSHSSAIDPTVLTVKP